MTTNRIPAEQAAQAFGQARTAGAELIGLWSEALPADKLAKLQGWLAAGVRVSLLLEDTAASIVLLDAEGRWQVLETIDFRAPSARAH